MSTVDTRPGRLDGDEGAIVIIGCFVLVGLLIICAIVVDIGLARTVKVSAQNTTDLAAVAAGYYLAGNGSASTVSNPRGACSAALNSVRTNVKDFPVAANLNCNAFPDDASTCTSSTAKITVAATNSNPYTLKVEWPVPDSDIRRSEFNGEVGKPANPGMGPLDGAPCERMRVSMTRSSPAAFGGIVGSTGHNLKAETVVRGSQDTGGAGIPALLLLERSACGSLQVSGGGATVVEGAGTKPGYIHTDTSALTTGQGGPCTLNNNAGGWGVYGTSRPAAYGNGPSIIAKGAGGSPGKIGTYAANPNVNGRSGYYYDPACNYDVSVPSCINSGLSVRPTPGRIVSRTPVDARYNKTGATYITQLHTNGWVRASASVPYGQATYTDPSGLVYKVVDPTQNGGCTQSNKVFQNAANGGADNWFINCPEFTASNVVFRGFRFVFTGRLKVQNGYLAFPLAVVVYVRGCPPAGCSGSNSFAIASSSGGFISMNTGETVTGVNPSTGTGSISVVASTLNTGVAPPVWPWIACLTSRLGPGAGGTWTRTTRVATFGGNINVQNGSVNWCQTTIYAGMNASSYTKHSVTSGGNCTAALPCPKTSAITTDLPTININSGSAAPISWTAPNQATDGVSSTNPYEDLALWTESWGSCTIAGQGALLGAGVYFHPNCDFNYGGQTDNANGLNAQFIGRSLNISGQGVLKLKPNANDAISVPVAGDIYLIR